VNTLQSDASRGTNVPNWVHYCEIQKYSIRTDCNNHLDEAKVRVWKDRLDLAKAELACHPTIMPACIDS